MYFLVFKFTTKTPDTINNSANRILKVIGSPRTRPPSKTPAMGIMKMKECNETAPYFWSMLAHATKPKEAVIRPWYKREAITFKFASIIIVSSQKKPARKNKGTEPIVG